MKYTLSLVVASLCLTTAAANAQLILADDFNVTGNGSGFLLGEGLNSGINPPTTRLTGSAAADLRYINRAAKVDTAYLIGGNSRMRVNSGSQSGRVTLSADGTNSFDFAPALGIPFATAANPVEYDITIAMDNNATGIQRFSFALGTVEGSAGAWDFGLQLHRLTAGDDFYTVSKRIDTGSSGLGADQNDPILAMASGSVGTEVSFLIRVTDAGEEASSFNSRLRISQDGGATWFYDTDGDTSLTSGWRLDGAGRFFSWDIAANDSFVTYDNFSVNVVTPAVPEPSTMVFSLLGGTAALLLLRRRNG